MGYLRAYILKHNNIASLTSFGVGLVGKVFLSRGLRAGRHARVFFGVWFVPVGNMRLFFTGYNDSKKM